MKSAYAFFAETCHYKVSLFFGPRKWVFIRSHYFFRRGKWVAIRSNNFQIYPKMGGYKVSRRFHVRSYSQPEIQNNRKNLKNTSVTLFVKNVLSKNLYLRDKIPTYLFPILIVESVVNKHDTVLK